MFFDLRDSRKSKFRRCMLLIEPYLMLVQKSHFYLIFLTKQPLVYANFIEYNN
jgi:hypothetical protein